MWKKIIMILVTFFIVSCGSTKKLDKWYNIGNGNTTISYLDTLQRYQLDSLCYADNVSSNYRADWMKSVARDYETKKAVSKYLFVKTVQDSTEILYTLRTIDNPLDTLYIVEKRITYYENE